MKKIFYILAALLLVVTACSQNGLTPDGQDGDRITFTMNLNVPERSVLTKTMGDVPGKDLHVYVLVFGSKGNLNDLVQAIPDSDAEFTEDANGHRYKKYAVSLKRTDSEQHVHVVATNRTLDLAAMLDGGTSLNESIMDTFKSEGTDDAYWQYLKLEKGTNAPGAAAAFNSLKLVRNFAKITVALKTNSNGDPDVTLPEGITNFEILGFEVYNKPTSGTFVIKKDDAYYPEYSNFDATKFDALRKVYPGYMVSEKDIDVTNAGKFPDDNPDGKMVDYLYERTVSSIDQNPTYVIMKCSYDKGTETGLTRYYRLDLVDENEDYLPIFRNFLYKMVIKAVGHVGYESIAEAQEHSANGNISLDPATQDLDDISDGVSRMYVQYIEKVFVQSTEAQTGYFRYMYLPDAEDETSSTSAALSTPDNTSIVSAVSTGWNAGGTKATDGWYDLSFTIPGNSPAGIAKFTVTGTHPDHANKKLIRTVRIRVEPRKSFSSTSAPTSIAVNGTGQVSVTLPPALPASMFPIELKFEDTAGALNPNFSSDDGKDLVAGGGPSLSGSGVNAVQFTKTISYDVYTASANRVFTATFKRISSGRTTLYIGNEYFTTVNKTIN
ncbi:MAG: hypothetical protein IJ603_00020 [Bacteroidales bacterium]|nr:hypothetical protein [Bacteroidales bacterium]